MRAWALAWFGIVVAIVGGCSENRPFGGDSGGSDASMDGGRCTSNAECNDNTPCTRDLCLVGGVCEHTPDNTMCTAPMVCVSGRGCTTPGARTCTTPAECDDRIPCTRDTCLVEGTCRNTPDDTMCPMGQACNPASGCGAQTRCTGPADCDDRVMCTEDTCGVDGRCVHVPQNMRCAAGQTCNMTMGCVVVSACENNAQCDDRVYCNGMERCSSELACVAGTAVNCDDMDPCTRDACNEAMRACTHEREPSCMGMTPRSGFYSVMPGYEYRCMDNFVGMTVVEFSVTQFQFTITAGGLTVNASDPTRDGGSGIPAMTGPPPTAAGAFTVRGMRSGDCNELYELSGTFTSTTTYTATFQVSFAGPSCVLTNCMMRSWMLMGTARM